MKFKPVKPGPELERIITEAPEQGYFPLGYFAERMNFTPEELQGELAAGRLIAFCHGKAALKRMQKMTRTRKGSMSADDFAVTLKAVRDWLHHPKTPPHLIDKLCRALGPKH
jgi:hypothetical protein